MKINLQIAFILFLRRRRLIVRYEMRKAQKGSFELGWRYRFRSFLIVPQIHHRRKIPPPKKPLVKPVAPRYIFIVIICKVCMLHHVSVSFLL